MLDRLAQEQETAGGGLYKFYLPNCDKNGLYHSKQVCVLAEGAHPCKAALSSHTVSSPKHTPESPELFREVGSSPLALGAGGPGPLTTAGLRFQGSEA